MASRMTCRDSSLDDSKKPQVLTTMASAGSSEDTTVKPASRTVPSICSESTKFLGQPKLIKATRSMLAVVVDDTGFLRNGTKY